MKRATTIASAILLAATCVFAQEQDSNVQQAPATKPAATAQQDTLSQIDQTTAEQPAKKVRRATAGIGIRGGYNITNYWGTKDLNGAEEEASGWGFDAGVAARFEIIDVVWFTPELHFEYFKVTQDYDEIEIQQTQSNLALPLLLRAVLHPRAFFEVGPQLNLNLSNKLEYDAEMGDIHVPGSDITVKRPEDFGDDIEQATLGFGVVMGVGFYIIPDHLSINARFYVGLADLYPDATSVMLYEDDSNKDRKVKESDCKVMEGTKLRAINLGLSLWFL